MAEAPTYVALVDCVHWVTHCHPRASLDNVPVGRVAAARHVDAAIKSCRRRQSNKRTKMMEHNAPPSVRHKLDQLYDAASCEAWKSDLPAERAMEDAERLAPLFASAMQSLQEPVKCKPVHVSMSWHDDRMLRYGRNVPLCSLGVHCMARAVPGNRGPLPIYVSPPVQVLLDKNEPVPPFDATATCLLCIRRDVHAAVLSWNALVPDPLTQISPMARIPPPFANMVNVPGGYKREYIVGGPGCPAFGTTAIAGVSNKVAVAFDVKTQEFYFDQSAIVFAPSHFL